MFASSIISISESIKRFLAADFLQFSHAFLGVENRDFIFCLMKNFCILVFYVFTPREWYKTHVKRYQILSSVFYFKIETLIVEFEAVLGSVENQLKSSDDFFRNTVSPFNGSIQLNTEVPQPKNIRLIHIRVKRNVQLVPKNVDAAYVIQMADGFIRSSGQNNISGQYVYTTIKDQYKQVLL